MHIDLLAAVTVFHRDRALVVPFVGGIHLPEVGPVTDATRLLARVLPLPVKSRATRQLPFLDDVLGVVAVVLDFFQRIARANQLPRCVVAIGDLRV